MSCDIRPMPSTFPHVMRLDDVFPGLRLVEKFHPPSSPFPDPSYELLAALKGLSGKRKSLISKDEKRLSE